MTLPRDVQGGRGVSKTQTLWATAKAQKVCSKGIGACKRLSRQGGRPLTQD